MTETLLYASEFKQMTFLLDSPALLNPFFTDLGFLVGSYYECSALDPSVIAFETGGNALSCMIHSGAELPLVPKNGNNLVLYIPEETFYYQGLLNWDRLDFFLYADRNTFFMDRDPNIVLRQAEDVLNWLIRTERLRYSSILDLHLERNWNSFAFGVMYAEVI